MGVLFACLKILVAFRNQMIYTGHMAEKRGEKRKFYWHANTSSGGTLSLSLNYEGGATKKQKESFLAEGIRACTEVMEEKGYIPYDAVVMSSGDLARNYGSTRQYWEKLLNEGKIHYKETAAGRITTNLWVQGYLDNRDKVNKYVLDVKAVLETIDKSGRTIGAVMCSVCNEEHFEYAVNGNDNVNGLCRACGFHIHTTK